ncbi:SET domain-containing protein 5 [Scheffersomyces spartinae]|uniref:Histone-lysine N-methyltransferase SET5 n=1 Tax=Scheffersomyces spartinae TaxID=45513 RepID=A0A9P7VB87_9ASCO|nr:SET domain-containing protein 5 [Scheffersomyces spartinae]KAG7194813.1 SET domain-containing protein 5 [Scheffersomyces spartinae]
MTGNLTQKIEVIKINDFEPEPQEQIIPHERQIVDSVIAIWKEDKDFEGLGMAKLHALVKKRHPSWSVSEKRVKSLLKKYGLANNQEQFTYALDITSEMTPDIDMPDKVHIVMTSKRGKGLYAKKNIAKDEVIWEESQLFFVPPLANVKLMSTGKACAYCGILLSSKRAFKGGLDCNVCQEVWCSQNCKKIDHLLHISLKHNVYHPGGNKLKKQIDAACFLDLQDYCAKEQWNALYAITLIYAQIIQDKTGVKGKQFKAMARVSQEIRYRALNSSAGAFDNMQGGALFVQEQQEELWRDGFEKFKLVFPKTDVDYKEFMFMLGTYNINNLDLCMYLTQSHLNHNCEPNTKVILFPQSRTRGLQVIAARDIKAGEELTTTYVNPLYPVQQRQRELRVNWGFVCGCQRCKDEAKSRERRKSSTGSQGHSKAEIKQMLQSVNDDDDEPILLDAPQDSPRERRKSVRFDEQVVAVSE